MNPLSNVEGIRRMNERELKEGLTGSNQSWHHRYKSSAWVFVGGLPYDLSEGDIVCVFSQFGEIVNINLVRDKDTRKSKGFCFVCYEDQRSTVLTIDNFNGAKLLGRTLRVDHVLDYKMPKKDEENELDEVTLQVRREGIAPKPVPVNVPKPAVPLGNKKEKLPEQRNTGNAASDTGKGHSRSRSEDKRTDRHIDDKRRGNGNDDDVRSHERSHDRRHERSHERSHVRSHDRSHDRFSSNGTGQRRSERSDGERRHGDDRDNGKHYRDNDRSNYRDRNDDNDKAKQNYADEKERHHHDDKAKRSRFHEDGDSDNNMRQRKDRSQDMDDQSPSETNREDKERNRDSKKHKKDKKEKKGSLGLKLRLKAR